MKRHASGMSAEELSIQDAFIEGQRAGGQSLSAALNPNRDGTPEHDAWERGRRSAEAMKLARAVGCKVEPIF